MLACFPSLHSTPPRSPGMGVMIRCQFSPPSVVRSSVPAAPAIQQMFFAGAEPLVRVALTATGCDSHVLPPSPECAIAPSSPNLQMLFSCDATMLDGSSAGSIAFPESKERLASFRFRAVPLLVSAAVSEVAACTVTCCAPAPVGAGGGTDVDGEATGARPITAPGCALMDWLWCAS